MRMYPGLLANAVRSALRSKHDLVLENLALRQQLAVLTRQRARTRTKPADRLFWSWLSCATRKLCPSRSEPETASLDRRDLVLPPHGCRVPSPSALER